MKVVSINFRTQAIKIFLLYEEFQPTPVSEIRTLQSCTAKEGCRTFFCCNSKLPTRFLQTIWLWLKACYQSRRITVLDGSTQRCHLNRICKLCPLPCIPNKLVLQVLQPWSEKTILKMERRSSSETQLITN